MKKDKILNKLNKIAVKTIDSINFETTPEQEKELDAYFEELDKFHAEHPDYNERYGTDRSYWLEEIKEAGFNPIGITVMLAEETIIMETEEELDEAAKMFAPEGWWYSADQWEEAREKYVRDFYDGVVENAPKVYWLK